MDNVRKYLEGKGYNPIAASTYTRFVEATLDSLRKAEKSLNDNANWEVFIDKDGALNKPKKYPGISRKISIPSEVAITTELKIILDSLRKNCDADDVLRVLDIFFEVELPSPSKTKTGIKSNRVDVRVRSFREDNDLEIVYEAKNIVTESDIKNKYLASDGIMCLIRKSESYSKNPISGMIAYTVTDDHQTWIDKVIKNTDNSFKTKEPTKLIKYKNHTKKPALLSSFLEDSDVVEKSVIHLILKFSFVEY